jgi:protein-disulfide isomerase
MKRLLIALLLLPGLARAASFTPEQRSEIVQILRQALKDDPSILRDAVTALQEDEGARQAVAARAAIQAARPALVADAADPVAGNPAGDVTIVEFYDTRCPYCRAMLPTIAALLQSDPRIRLVFKDLPVLGPASVTEARALLAAQRQGGYAKLQEVLMHGTAQPTEDSLRDAASRLGLDGARLLRDMADPAIQARLDGNIRLARSLGVQGTPALVIGDQVIPGAVDAAELRQAVAAVRKG